MNKLCKYGESPFAANGRPFHPFAPASNAHISSRHTAAADAGDDTAATADAGEAAAAAADAADAVDADAAAVTKHSETDLMLHVLQLGQSCEN